MYCVWELHIKKTTRFFQCGMDTFEGDDDILWNFGKKVENIPSILKYYAKNNLEPEDYPMTVMGCHFLVSERIVQILRRLDVKEVQYFESEIVKPNGKIIKNYYTLNILNDIDCIDKGKSEYTVTKFGLAEMFDYTKLFIDIDRVPTDIKMFLLTEANLVIVHESIKQEMEVNGITGVVFKPAFTNVSP